MKMILSPNPYRDRGLRCAQEAQRQLQRAGITTVYCLPFVPKKGERLELPRQIQFRDLQEELPGTDLILCFGGDGTILHAARASRDYDIPILGINMGSVGFMAELERGELSRLAGLSQGGFVTEERMMLQVRVLRGDRLLYEDIALNDAVFSKGSVARVAEVEILADGVSVETLSGDGVTVATPTGSTAYSMSAGGPIIEPTARNIILTPVCAHQLGARPLVLDSERTVTVRMPKGNRKQIYLSVDGGKSVRLTGHDRAEISRARKCTRLVRLTQRSFYQIINQKLGGYHG